jgi:microcystin-dependent protein
MANNAFDETMFPDPGGQDSGALPESEAFSFLDSDDMGSGPTAQEIGSTTDRLLQLQIQLHHLSVTTDQATAMNQPAAEEVLEATKSFLEILQASLAAQSCIPQPTSAIASTADALTGWNDPNPAAMSYITVLQVLTCYSYVLHVLDPVVSALIIQKAESTVRTEVPSRAFSNAGLEKSSQTALTMGFFNLASQPAMNADVVLHIILRMIQQLRVSIHLLASGHRDLVGEISDRVGIGSPAVDTTHKLHATPISISSQPIVKLISAREEPLVERLSHLINGQ